MFAKQNLSEVPLDKPLNVLCHRDDVEVVNDLDDVLEITPESTLQMAAKFTDRTWAAARADADFVRRLQAVYPDMDITKDDRPLSAYPVAVRHVVGLIICTNMAINTNRRPFWRTPEAYLHPSTQANLANLVMMYLRDAEENQDAPTDPDATT